MLRSWNHSLPHLFRGFPAFCLDYLPSLPCQCRAIYVPPSATILDMRDYADLVGYGSVTGHAYKGVPLSMLSSASRAFQLEKVAHRHDEEASQGRGLLRRCSRSYADLTRCSS